MRIGEFDIVPEMLTVTELLNAESTGPTNIIKTIKTAIRMVLLSRDFPVLEVTLLDMNRTELTTFS